MVALLPKPLCSYSSLAWARNESGRDRDELSLQHLLGTRQLMVSVPPTSMPWLPFWSPLDPGPYTHHCLGALRYISSKAKAPLLT